MSRPWLEASSASVKYFTAKASIAGVGFLVSIDGQGSEIDPDLANMGVARCQI